MSASETLSKTRAATKPETRTPPLYKVLLLNDDYTTWEFVVFVLQRYFRKGAAEAERITRDVHQKGVGVAGVYPFEIAETKAQQATRCARQEGHPLRLELEPA